MKETKSKATGSWQPPRPSRLLLEDRSQSRRFANAMAMKFALTNPRLERARQVARPAPQRLRTRAS